MLGRHTQTNLWKSVQSEKHPKGSVVWKSSNVLSAVCVAVSLQLETMLCSVAGTHSALRIKTHHTDRIGEFLLISDSEEKQTANRGVCLQESVFNINCIKTNYPDPPPRPTTNKSVSLYQTEAVSQIAY